MENAATLELPPAMDEKQMSAKDVKVNERRSPVHGRQRNKISQSDVCETRYFKQFVHVSSRIQHETGANDLAWLAKAVGE